MGIFEQLPSVFESIVTKFRKRLALIKPPLEKLLLQIETKPDITGKDETKVLLTLFPFYPFRGSEQNRPRA